MTAAGWTAVPPSSPAAKPSGWRAFLHDAWIWLPLALLTALFAHYVATGGRAGVLPKIDHPLPALYAGDGMGLLWTTRKLVDGAWIYHTDRSGYPFGSDYLDYPMSDSGSFAVLKLLAVATGSPWGALDLYFLLGFAAAVVACFGAMRAFGVSRALSAAAALLFALLPFHFFRVQHMLLTWYFTAPLFFLIGWSLYGRDTDERVPPRSRSAWLLGAIALLLLSCFNVYHAVFGAVVIVTGGVAGFARTRQPARLLLTVAAVVTLGIGTLLNVLPSVEYTARNGPNVEVAQRSPGDAEIYGLKLVQMLLPRADHRVDAMRAFARRYADNAPLVNENHTAALGVIGSLGLLLLGAVAFVRICGAAVDGRLVYLALCAAALFVTATVGGLSSLFSFAITPLLRGWNRASVFIGFAAIAAAMIALDRPVTAGKRASWLPATLAAAAVTIPGAFDQTVPACDTCLERTHRRFDADAAFVAGIERALPRGAAVYQLPYVPFPEGPAVNGVQSYDHVIGAVHSNALKWSYAGMKGRDGDLFYRGLAQEPMDAQIDVLRRLGFAGVYIDRRGYADHGKAIEGDIQRMLRTGPLLERDDGAIAFYRVDGGAEPIAGRIEPSVAAARLGPLDPVRLRVGEPVDFRMPRVPPFMRGVQGLAQVESWGRWSDATLQRDVVISFVRPLPESFTLVLRALAFGPNTGAPVLVSAGGDAVPITLTEGITEQRIRLSNPGRRSHDIRIRPPQPISPSEWRGGDDRRRIGVGLEQLRVEP